MPGEWLLNQPILGTQNAPRGGGTGPRGGRPGPRGGSRGRGSGPRGGGAGPKRGGKAGGRGAPILRRKDVARALGLANAVRRGGMEVKVQLIGVRECTQIMVGGGRSRVKSGVRG